MKHIAYPKPNIDRYKVQRIMEWLAYITFGLLLLFVGSLVWAAFGSLSWYYTLGFFLSFAFSTFVFMSVTEIHDKMPVHDE